LSVRGSNLKSFFEIIFSWCWWEVSSVVNAYLMSVVIRELPLPSISVVITLHKGLLCKFHLLLFRKATSTEEVVTESEDIFVGEG